MINYSRNHPPCHAQTICDIICSPMTSLQSCRELSISHHWFGLGNNLVVDASAFILPFAPSSPPTPSSHKIDVV